MGVGVVGVGGGASCCWPWASVAAASGACQQPRRAGAPAAAASAPASEAATHPTHATPLLAQYLMHADRVHMAIVGAQSVAVGAMLLSFLYTQHWRSHAVSLLLLPCHFWGARQRQRVRRVCVAAAETWLAHAAVTERDRCPLARR